LALKYLQEAKKTCRTAESQNEVNSTEQRRMQTGRTTGTFNNLCNQKINKTIYSFSEL